jgi:hypothetical protein
MLKKLIMVSFPEKNKLAIPIESKVDLRHILFQKLKCNY